MCPVDTSDPREWAVGWEQRRWERDPDRSVSRRQALTARGPYRAALPANIAERDARLTSAVQAEAEDAARELARFDAEVGTALSRMSGEPAVELAPLASVLLRTESASSSQIEGVTAGARALALADIDESVGSNAQLVTANVAAMRSALDLSDALSIDAVLAAHHALLGGHGYARPGNFRISQVWIGARAISPHTASFVPPHHDRIGSGMADLMTFVQRVDLPVLAHVALAHAQFETIHPFVDGNGRIGRTLVHAMLRHHGVTRRMTVPISAGLLTDTRGYFDALTAYRDGDIEPIITAFTAATFAAIANGRSLVSELESIVLDWGDRLTARRGSAARRMLPLLLARPAITVALVADSLGVATSAAQRAVEQLAGSGVIAPVSDARRNRVWLAGEVIAALDSFGERVGRRG